jgi:hypothetical protein
MSPGCGGPAAEAPPSVARFAISYERSGGLAAMPQKLVIRPGRHAAVTTRDTDSLQPRTVRFRIGVKRIESLSRALEKAHFETIGTPGPNPGACADCFYYAIGYQGHEVGFSQIEVPKGLRSVIGQLEAVIAAH